MTANEILASPSWTCQWTCQNCGHVNTLRKHEVPSDITSHYDLDPHLTCGVCRMNVDDLRKSVIILWRDHP
jgi:hypothetical protein